MVYCLCLLAVSTALFFMDAASLRMHLISSERSKRVLSIERLPLNADDVSYKAEVLLSGTVDKHERYHQLNVTSSLAFHRHHEDVGECLFGTKLTSDHQLICHSLDYWLLS